VQVNSWPHISPWSIHCPAAAVGDVRFLYAASAARIEHLPQLIQDIELWLVGFIGARCSITFIKEAEAVRHHVKSILPGELV
jgi:hypothetical protein